LRRKKERKKRIVFVKSFLSLSLPKIFVVIVVKRLPSEAGLLNKSSCLAPTLGVTKFIIVKGMRLATLCCAT
jgi:hypothetical protein